MEPNDPSSKGMKKKLTVAQSNFINKGMSKCSSPCQIYITWVMKWIILFPIMIVILLPL